MSLSEMCAKIASKKGDTSKITDKNVLEFITAPWGLGLGSIPGVPPLYPAQRFIIKCYYGLELDDSDNRDIIIKDKFNEVEYYRFNETEYMKYLFDEGRINKMYDAKSTANMVLALGRRSGKTAVTACIISYELYRLLNKYCPQEYYNIMPEDNIYMTCISTSRETAKELFDKVTGNIERSEFFRKFRRKPTKQWMFFQTQRDIDKYGLGGRNSLGVRVAPCNARGLRGPGNIIVAFDEMAFFFLDEKTGQHKNPTGTNRNDVEIYNAVTPSVAKFKKPDGTPEGKIICISSPGGKNGKFFEEYERAYDPENKDLFVMRAPSWEIDPGLSTEFLKSKYKENPISFRSEFGAEFSDRLFGWIDDPDLLKKNVTEGLRFKSKSIERVPHFMGIDVGLKTDGTAICVGHWTPIINNGTRTNKLEVDYCQAKYADDEGKEWLIDDELVDWIVDVSKKFNVVKGLMDHYYGMTMIPKLHRKGLKQFEFKQFTDLMNSTVYQNFLSLLITEQIRIPEGEEAVISRDWKSSPLIAELLTLQAEQRSKYIIKVRAPEREGMHDDLSDSLARMCFLAVEYKNKGGTISSSVSTSNRIHAVRMIRHSERMKFSLNRSAGMSFGMGRSRSLIPTFNRSFR